MSYLMFLTTHEGNKTKLICNKRWSNATDFLAHHQSLFCKNVGVNYLGRARRLYVVVRGAVKERAQSAIDGIPHHGEKLAISPLVDKCIPGQRG